MKLYVDTTFKNKPTYGLYFWITDEEKFYDPQNNPIDFKLGMIFHPELTFRNDVLILEY